MTSIHVLTPKSSELYATWPAALSPIVFEQFVHNDTQNLVTAQVVDANWNIIDSLVLNTTTIQTRNLETFEPSQLLCEISPDSKYTLSKRSPCGQLCKSNMDCGDGCERCLAHFDRRVYPVKRRTCTGYKPWW